MLRQNIHQLLYFPQPILVSREVAAGKTLARLHRERKCGLGDSLGFWSVVLLMCFCHLLLGILISLHLGCRN